MLVQVVEHDVGHGVTLEEHDHAHAGLVTLVADVGDAVDDLLLDQVGDALDEHRLVHLVGDLRDDQRLAIALELLDLDGTAHGDAPASGAEGVDDAGPAEDLAAGGKIWAMYILKQVTDVQLGILEQGDQRVDDLGHVVGRDVGGHAHRDARGAVDQQVRETGGEHRRLHLLVVIVGDEVDGLLLDVGEHLGRQPRHAHLGVPHGRRRIAVDGAEVALSVDHRVAHRERLREPHQRLVDRRVAVRVEASHGVADDAGALLVGRRGRVLQDVHGVQDAPVHGFESVAHVGQGAGHDHAHRIIEERALHLLGDAHRDDTGSVFHQLITHEFVLWPPRPGTTAPPWDRTGCRCWRAALPRRPAWAGPCGRSDPRSSRRRCPRRR